MNMSKSQELHERIARERIQNRHHLSLCNEIYCHQNLHRRHAHLEQPNPSTMLKQDELQDFIQGSYRSVFDMCRVGRLRLPQKEKYLQKRTSVLTTSGYLDYHSALRIMNMRSSKGPCHGREHKLMYPLMPKHIPHLLGVSYQGCCWRNVNFVNPRLLVVYRMAMSGTHLLLGTNILALTWHQRILPTTSVANMELKGHREMPTWDYGMSKMSRGMVGPRHGTR